MRNCLKAFWSMKLEPAVTDENMDLVGSMPLWGNHILKVDTEWISKQYMKEHLEVVLLSLYQI